jgi:hypothetical protein
LALARMPLKSRKSICGSKGPSVVFVKITPAHRDPATSRSLEPTNATSPEGGDYPRRK